MEILCLIGDNLGPIEYCRLRFASSRLRSLDTAQQLDFKAYTVATRLITKRRNLMLREITPIRFIDHPAVISLVRTAINDETFKFLMSNGDFHEMIRILSNKNLKQLVSQELRQRIIRDFSSNSLLFGHYKPIWSVLRMHIIILLMDETMEQPENLVDACISEFAFEGRKCPELVSLVSRLFEFNSKPQYSSIIFLRVAATHDLELFKLFYENRNSAITVPSGPHIVHYVAQYGSKEMIKFMLADPTLSLSKGEADPLLSAVGNPDVFKLLYADNRFYPSGHLINSLVTNSHSDVESLELLLADDRLNPNQFFHGQAPIMIAVANRRANMVKVMLDCIKVDHNIRDGRNVFDIARKKVDWMYIKSHSRFKAAHIDLCTKKRGRWVFTPSASNVNEEQE